MLKVQAAFFLAECSKVQEERGKLRKEALNKKRTVLNDLRNSQSIQIQKKEKEQILGDSLLGKCALKRRPRVCLENVLLNGLGVCFLDPLNHLRRGQEERESYPGKICGGLSCQMAQIPMTYTGDLQGFQECCLSRNAALGLKGTKKQRPIELLQAQRTEP